MEHELKVDVVEVPVPPTVAELYQVQVKRWKVAAIVLFIGLTIQLVLNIWTVDSLIYTVDTLEDATGPEARQQQARVVNELVITVDCNNRDALQEFSDELVKQRIIGQITVVTPECSDRG